MMATKLEKDRIYLERALKYHRGGWLTAEVVAEYQRKAADLHDSGVYEGERRRLGQKLIEEYGVTELEAINILNGHRAYDYIAKYERIRTQIPLMIKEEKKDSKKKEEEEDE